MRERVGRVCTQESLECLMTCLDSIAAIDLMTGVKSIKEDSVIEHPLLYSPGISSA